MARKKEPAKPLLTLKFDFYASVDNVIHESIMLVQSVEQMLDLSGDAIPESVATLLHERVKAFREAIFTDG
jgi:hypothetical protein